MYLGSNLKLLRKRKKKSQEDISQDLGLTRSSYSGYENGVAEPGIDTLIALSAYFKVPLDNLVKKDFTTLSETQLESVDNGMYSDIKGSNLRVLTTTINQEDNEMIELVPAKARAGYSVGYADPDYISVLPTFSLPFLSKNRKYRSFPIEGDSMPPVMEGSFVVGEFVQNWATVKSGTPFIVVTKDEGIVFKIVQNLLGSSQSFQLCSTNPIYDPYLVHANDIVEMWKFVNYICPEMPEVKVTDNDLLKTVKHLQNEVHELKNYIVK